MYKVFYEVQIDCDPTFEVDEISDLISEHLTDKGIKNNVSYRWTDKKY